MFVDPSEQAGKEKGCNHRRMRRQGGSKRQTPLWTTVLFPCISKDSSSIKVVSSFKSTINTLIFCLSPQRQQIQFNMANFRQAATIMGMMLGFTNAFVLSPSSSLTSSRNQFTSSLQMADHSNLVIISPPGGVGEVAAVEAAKMGSSVRWFVISPPSSTSSVSLDAATMESISGTVELAGAQADTLLLPKDDSSSAVNAVASWCSAADGVICIVDGLEESVAAVNAQAPGKGLDFSELEKMRNAMMDAIKIAAQEATSSASKDGMKIAVLPADVDRDDEEGADKGNGGLLSGIFGGGDVPASVTDAMKGDNLAILRYGELFGIPESSVRNLSHDKYHAMSLMLNFIH